MNDYSLPTKSDLPPGWEAGFPHPGNAVYLNRKRDLRILISVTDYDDNLWVHVSYSHGKRMPNQETTNYVKKHFIGDHLEAIAVYPPQSRHVNVHEFCLHLWAPLEDAGKTWPNFENDSALGRMI